MKTDSFTVRVLCGLLLGGGAPVSAPAQSVVLNPVADTTLIEAAPNNNLGGGNYVNAGTTQNFTQNRGLFRFDPVAAIPAGATITSVSVTFEVVGQPVDGYSPSQFGLYRVLAPWGEGDKNPASNPGLGLPAAAGEATWNDRFAQQSAPWNSPGGAPGQDYASTPSGETFIYDVNSSPYVFGSTAMLVSDVQGWLDQPAGNFGWMLISQSEAVDFTARRFASREDPGRAPILEIQYAVIPEPGAMLLLAAGGVILAVTGRKRNAPGANPEEIGKRGVKE